MLKIEITSTVRRPIHRSALLRAAAAALRGAAGQVSVAVLGDRRMARLHAQSLGIDAPTDVLSFDHGDTPEGRLLEIIVCAPQAGRAAMREGVPYRQELARYVVHGCLHLNGYDDDCERARKRLWRRQEAILRELYRDRYKAQ